MRGDERWDETWHRLREWTAGQAPSERLSAQVLQDQGFKEVDPSHPLGGTDAGADALAERDGERWVMAVYFPRGQQEFATIKKKFLDDFAGVASNDAAAMAFVTNQELRRAERRLLAQAVDKLVWIYHLERVVAILDQPRMHSVRQQFLGIEATGQGKYDAAERLDELWRASIARSAARWAAVGLPPEEARALAEERAVGEVAGEWLPSEGQPVVVWTAPMGSGKSIGSERHHQARLEAAANEEGAPVPVFLRAAECLPSLQKAVEAAAEEVGHPRARGADVVVDGVDEVGHQAAGQLLTQARVLVGTWPSTTILLTSRPIPALVEAPENRTLPQLAADEQEECIALGAGRGITSTSLFSLPQPVRATLGQPLFALLVGMSIRHRDATPRAPIDLMVMLGERGTRDLAVDQTQLRALATRSVARELGPVPTAEILGGAPIDPLLATGMVADRGSGLAFVLPALAQWFAAQALLLGEIAAEELLEAPEDLELWRYPLGLAIALGSARQANSLLFPLLDREAGFALRVLDAAFGQAILGGAIPPPWREGGRQVRESLQALARALGPLAPSVADTDETGRVLPMGVASDERHLTIAFRHVQDRQDIFALAAEADPVGPDLGWGTVRSSVVGPGAAWAWHWSMTGIRSALERVLRGRLLPLPLTGPLADEEVWASACDVANKSVLTAGALELRLLSGLLAEIADSAYEQGPVLFKKGGGPTHDLRELRQRVLRLRSEGHHTLDAPIPPADRLPNGGWVGEFFSGDRLLEAATRIYKAAILAYRQLVERWMPTLLQQLEHYVLMPVRVVGFVNTGREEEHGFGAIPHLSGYLEPLPGETDDEVVMKISEGSFDLSVGESVWAQQRAARPTAERWLTGTVGGMPLEIGGRYPVSDVVYDWIAHDLKRLGLVGSLASHRSGEARRPWDVS